jgi:NADH dehydrogenase
MVLLGPCYGAAERRRAGADADLGRAAHVGAARSRQHRLERGNMSPVTPALKAGESAHRVVIVGGGFGGLFAAKFLRHAPVQVTLIDRTNHHTFQPLLYQLATGILSEGAVAPPLREVLRAHANVRVHLADVTGFDLKARTVTATPPLGPPLHVPYDSLIVSAGATGSYFGHDEFGSYAPGMKTVDDALELRARIFTFAVIGGGPTGVEMAGQIAELSRRALRGNFRRIDPATARVLLFDGGEKALPTFGNRLSAIGTRELTRAGVELRLRSRVVGVTHDEIVVQGPDGEERVRCHAKVWAAGVQASPLAAILAEATGAQTDRAGHIAVLADCTLPGHPEVFAVGDMMSLDGLPGVAEVAMQSGIHAARTIKRRLEGDTVSRPFKYHDLGSMATISRFRAIVSFKGIKVGGFIGWLMWAFVHLTFLTGFKNRFTALSKWLTAFVGTARDERTVTMQQASARIIAMHAGVRPGEEDLTRLVDEHPAA